MSDLDSNGPRHGGGRVRRCFRNNGGEKVASGGDADAEFLARCQPPGKQSARARLPYGCWTCADGREILFSRAYAPLWQRSPDGRVTRANPEERVPWIQQKFYFNDGDAPFYPRWLPSKPKLTAERKATKARCESVLADWGVG
jgi:hypothetical protein